MSIVARAAASLRAFWSDLGPGVIEMVVAKAAALIPVRIVSGADYWSRKLPNLASLTVFSIKRNTNERTPETSLSIVGAPDALSGGTKTAPRYNSVVPRSRNGRSVWLVG